MTTTFSTIWSGILIALLLVCGAMPNQASAEIIDDISIRSNSNGDVDAIIRFTVPIQQIRYFPRRKSEFMVIHFNILDNVPLSMWQNYDARRSPPSDLIRGFWISTRDLETGPKIEVRFDHEVEYTLSAGSSGRSLLLHIKADKRKAIQAPKAELPLAVPPVVVTPPVVLPVPKTAATAPAKKSTPAKSTQAAKPSSTKLGGKDGFPKFPKIMQVDLDNVGKAPSDDLNVKQHIIQANSQAAIEMAKGRDAMLAGEIPAAIEAFNNVLNLAQNRYSQDAQMWVGIAREKSGQRTRSIAEYKSYIKLYPKGKSAKWVKNRIALIDRSKSIKPATPIVTDTIVAQASDFITTSFGSLSMYYYHGSSKTDTISTVGGIQTPSSLSTTDQSALLTNVNASIRSYNDVFDNRISFQDFYAVDFLPNGENRNRLNAAFFEVRNRHHDYSARVGRQSAYGGGVLGRFDGISAGYGFLPNWRFNANAGRLSDSTLDAQPMFTGFSLDFGTMDALGGSIYSITQSVGGNDDRKAVGGTIRYFDQDMTSMAIWDYDRQFRLLNMFTLQGTFNSESGIVYSYLVDQRRSPSLSIGSAVSGTTATVDSLLQNGWTQDDLIALAKKRTATTNMAQFGMTGTINKQWQWGSDFVISNTSSMSASGTLNPDGTTGIEGFVPASASSGNSSTLTARVIGNDLLIDRDLAIFSLGYNNSPTITGKTMLLNHHAALMDLWTLDTTLRMYWQNDSSGGKETVISPTLKVGYKVKSNLTVEVEGGVEQTSSNPSALQSSTISRRYFSLGFRTNF